MGGLVTRRSSSGSTIPRPMKCFQVRFTSALAKNGLAGIGTGPTGEGVGESEALTVTEGVGEGVGEADALTDGDGEGVGRGVVGDGVGVGVGAGVGRVEGEALGAGGATGVAGAVTSIDAIVTIKSAGAVSFPAVSAIAKLGENAIVLGPVAPGATLEVAVMVQTLALVCAIVIAEMSVSVKS